MSAPYALPAPAVEAVEAHEPGWVLGEWEALLSGAGLGLQVVDRIARDAAPNLRLPKGVHVEMPEGSNTGRMRDRAVAEMAETVTVQVLYRVNPQDQKASRNAALALGERVRETVTSRTWHPEWQVRIVSERRGPHPASAEWWLVEHVYTMRRLARVGG